MDRFQKLVLIIFCVGFSTLFAQNVNQDSLYVDSLSKYNAVIWKYNNDFHSANRIGFGISIPYTSFYEIESDFLSISFLNKDNNNNRKFNVSIYPILEFGIISLGIITLPESIKEKLLPPFYLSNSSHNFYLRGNPDYTYNNEKVGFNIALFVKNNTNLYVFRKNNWFEVAPGFGIKLYYKYFAVDIGYERKYQIFQHERPYSEDGFFYSITGYITEFE